MVSHLASVFVSNSTDRVGILTSVPRRRRWTASEKVWLAEEAFERMMVSLVARRYGVALNRLFTGRRPIDVYAN